MAFRQNIVDGKRLAQNQPIVNVFADYTLQRTVLKGLRLGTGVRYRGKQIIGSRASDTIANPANPLLSIDDPTVDAYGRLHPGGLLHRDRDDELYVALQEPP